MRSAVTYKFFCAEILLHASTFTQTYFDNTLTHTDRSFTHKYFCTVRFFRTGAFSQMHTHTRMLFHREVFKRACFYTEVFSHNDIFTQRFSCTEMLSHTETLLHTYTFTQRWLRPTPMLPERVQQAGAKPEFHCSSWWSHFVLKGFARANNMSISPVSFFNDRTAFIARGSIGKTIQTQKNVISPQSWHVLTIETQKSDAKSHVREFSRIETHFVGKVWATLQLHLSFWGSPSREGCVSWASIHAALQPSEKIEKIHLKL